MKLTTTDHIHTLHRNPLIMAPVIHAFYDDLKETHRNFLLSYLVLPFVLHESTSSYLHSIGSRNTWRTMISDKTRISGVHQRIQALRDTTNITLMSLVNSGYLIIDCDTMIVRTTKKAFPVLQGMKKKTISARNLAKLLEEREAPHVYKTLGIAQL